MSEFLKVASNGQWSLEKAKLKLVKPTSEPEKPVAPLKAKMLARDQPQGKKLEVQGAKIEAIRQLKSKNPNVDWDEMLAASLKEIQNLLKTYVNNVVPTDSRASEED